MSSNVVAAVLPKATFEDQRRAERYTVYDVAPEEAGHVTCTLSVKAPSLADTFAGGGGGEHLRVECLAREVQPVSTPSPFLALTLKL